MLVIHIFLISHIFESSFAVMDCIHFSLVFLLITCNKVRRFAAVSYCFMWPIAINFDSCYISRQTLLKLIVFDKITLFSFSEFKKSQRQYKVRVSGKMQLLQKKIEDNSPAQDRLTGQKQLLKRKEAVLATRWGAECQTL